jgi:hypothetical protein
MSADKNQPVTVHINIPDRNANGIWIVDRDPDWKGFVVVCPQACFETARSMKQFNQPGVYILSKQGLPGNPFPKIYIGHADPIKERLNNHYANPKKDWWEKVFICIGDSSGKLNRAHMQYLESRMIQMAKFANLCDHSENIAMPKLPAFSTQDEQIVDDFLPKLLFVLHILGLNIFVTPPNSGNGTSGESATGMFFINSKNIAAKGYQNAGEFVVLANSEAVLQIVPSALAGRIDIFRKSLESQGVLKAENGRLKFTKNYSFSSPSATAAVIIGGEADGRRQWKNEQGKSINDLEVEATTAIET